MVNQSCLDLIEEKRVNNRSKRFDGSPKMADRLHNSNSLNYLSFLYEDNDLQQKKSQERDELWKKFNM